MSKTENVCGKRSCGNFECVRDQRDDAERALADAEHWRERLRTQLVDVASTQAGLLKRAEIAESNLAAAVNLLQEVNLAPIYVDGRLAGYTVPLEPYMSRASSEKARVLAEAQVADLHEKLAGERRVSSARRQHIAYLERRVAEALDDGANVLAELEKARKDSDVMRAERNDEIDRHARTIAERTAARAALDNVIKVRDGLAAENKAALSKCAELQTACDILGGLVANVKRECQAAAEGERKAREETAEVLVKAETECQKRDRTIEILRCDLHLARAPVPSYLHDIAKELAHVEQDRVVLHRTCVAYGGDHLRIDLELRAE